MDVPNAKYEALRKATSFADLDEDDARMSLAKLVDGAAERGSVEGLRHAIALGTKLPEQQLSPSGVAVYDC